MLRLEWLDLYKNSANRWISYIPRLTNLHQLNLSVLIGNRSLLFHCFCNLVKLKRTNKFAEFLFLRKIVN